MKYLFVLFALAFATQGMASPNIFNPIETFAIDDQMSEATVDASFSSKYLPESEDALAFGGGCYNCTYKCCQRCSAKNHLNECIGHWYEFCCVRSPH